MQYTLDIISIDSTYSMLFVYRIEKYNWVYLKDFTLINQNINDLLMSKNNNIWAVLCLFQTNQKTPSISSCILQKKKKQTIMQTQSLIIINPLIWN